MKNCLGQFQDIFVGFFQHCIHSNMHILGEFYLKKIPIRVKKDRNFINALLVKKFLLSRKHKSKMNITLFLALLSCFYKSGEKFERCPSNWNEIEDKCIFVSKDEATLGKAKIKCKTWNSELLEPQNGPQNQRVFDQASCGLYFIGAEKEGM